jgi:hypothetical protein
MLIEEYFGQQEDVEWKLARDLPGALKLARAREQHELAYAVHLKLLAGRNSVPDLAQALNQRRESVWSKLSGRWPASEEDLFLWAWLTGEHRRHFRPTDLVDRPIPLPRFPLPRRRDDYR